MSPMKNVFAVGVGVALSVFLPVVHAFDIEDYATTYRATREAYTKALNEVILALGPFQAARCAATAGYYTYTSLQADSVPLPDMMIQLTSEEIRELEALPTPPNRYFQVPSGEQYTPEEILDGQTMLPTPTPQYPDAKAEYPKAEYPMEINIELEPNITVELPDITVEAPDVTVEAPDITVEATVEVPEDPEPEIVYLNEPEEVYITEPEIVYYEDEYSAPAENSQIPVEVNYYNYDEPSEYERRQNNRQGRRSGNGNYW